MKPLVSVIVPVYKVEDYLKRCLDSLCRQSLRDIEIILVDDVSPDRCGAICEEYGASDSRFRVIHHLEHRGLSAARNTGIKEAHADFIMFADSDDWVDVDFCRLPYECAVQYSADLVMFKNQQCSKTNFLAGLNSKVKDLEKSGYKTHEEAIELLRNINNSVVWSAL